MTIESGWYVTEAPSWINYVIINGNGGTAQTADHCGADWFEEAAESAVQYIGWGVQDAEMLIQLLTEEGFTHEQAVYGAENSGI